MTKIKVAVTSDFHGYLPNPSQIPGCDLLIISGDIAPDFFKEKIDKARFENTVKQFNWLDTEFRKWLNEVNAGEVVVTPGNHDFGLYNMSGTLDDYKRMRWHLLVDASITLFGLKIYGTPWIKNNSGWAYNVEDDQKLGEKWKDIPSDTDILVLHSPPFSILDRAKDGESCGSTTLAARILELEKVKLVTFGHIHEARGLRIVGDTTYINGAYVDRKYVPNGTFYEIVLDAPEKS